MSEGIAPIGTGALAFAPGSQLLETGRKPHSSQRVGLAALGSGTSGTVITDMSLSEPEAIREYLHGMPSPSYHTAEWRSGTR